MDAFLRELTLMLWQERGLETFRCSWKGYSFDVLNQLSGEDLIRGTTQAKTVHLTEAGIAEAQRLLEKYGLDHVLAKKAQP